MSACLYVFARLCVHLSVCDVATYLSASRALAYATSVALHPTLSVTRPSQAPSAATVHARRSTRTFRAVTPRDALPRVGPHLPACNVHPHATVSNRAAENDPIPRKEAERIAEQTLHGTGHPDSLLRTHTQHTQTDTHGVTKVIAGFKAHRQPTYRHGVSSALGPSVTLLGPWWLPPVHQPTMPERRGDTTMTPCRELATGSIQSDALRNSARVSKDSVSIPRYWRGRKERCHKPRNATITDRC